MTSLRSLRRRSVALLPLAAAALALGGCSSLGGVPGPMYPNPSKLYLMNSIPVIADRDVIDRYACGNDRPLVCECTGRVSSECVCRC